MDKTQIKKLYDIARAVHCTDTYISYIEYVFESNTCSFNARELANKIYKAAMLKYDASVHAAADAVEANCASMADQVSAVRSFAIANNLLCDYTCYIERIAMGLEKFDVSRALNSLIERAAGMYDMRLRRKIDSSTGITIIGGYKDAV